jgi:hypothetical protein
MIEEQCNAVALGIIRGLSERKINLRDQLLILHAAMGALLFAAEQLVNRPVNGEPVREKADA